VSLSINAAVHTQVDVPLPSIKLCTNASIVTNQS